MNKTVLGKLEPVDLRKIWLSESGGFTPWLAEEENLLLLGDTIGIELELEAQEKNVGPFRADAHLGQLLTYAAGLNAVTIVWIAAQLTDEHRAALDWLNEITNEEFNFFGLEIELWRIGESSIAPKFNIVSKPNDWSKAVSRTAAGTTALTDIKQLQLEYWTELRKLLLDKSKVIRPQKASPQHWTNFAIGRSNFSLIASVNTVEQSIMVGLGMYGNLAKSHFHLLHQSKKLIEEDIGKTLNWEELIGKKESRITIRRNVDLTNRKLWPEQHQWMFEELEAFHKALAPRIKSLDASKYVPEENVDLKTSLETQTHSLT